MSIQRLTPIDASAYYQLRLEALQLEPSAFGATYNEELINGEAYFHKILSLPGDDNVIFGAFELTTLVGIVGILLPHRSKMRHKATIWGMYVNASFRGKGYAGQLMDAAIAHAKGPMQAKVIGLTVESSSQSAHALYKSRGFKVWGTEKKAMVQDGKFTNEDHMDLEL